MTKKQKDVKIKKIFRGIVLRTLEKAIDINPEEEWSSIYIIKCNEYYKVGMAYDVEKRLVALQVGNPYLLEIIYKKKDKKCGEIHLYLFNYLSKKRIRGEWYKLDINDIERIKNIVEEYE